MRRLCAAAALLLLSTGWPAASVTGSGVALCHARANDTRARLLACMTRDALWQHLEEFQAIADRNPGHDGHGNRDTGTPGYLASVDYVADLMSAAGYEVTIQSYKWRRFALDGVPQFEVDGRHLLPAKDWFVARLSGSGSLTAQVRPAEGSRSGCSASDFRRFARGQTALLERGSCEFDAQVANAEAAGAAAVIFYNAEGPAGDTRHSARGDGGPYEAMLTSPARIPVIGVISHALGTDLAAKSRAGHAAVAHIQVEARSKSDIDYNVIADSPYGDPDHVVVVDAHLDSIYGAGILDNASGSATILELALNLANTRTRNRLRFIWFGGEERGLLGSRHYTRALSAKELKRIAFDIDVDVTATPNFDVLIADPAHAHNADKFPAEVLRKSKAGNKAFLDYFRSAGIVARKAWFGNSGTDSNAFSLVGVPNSGILTQQNCCKKDWEVALWGGYTGNYEGKVPGHNGGCVDEPERWCDNLSNNDPFVLEFISKAVASVVLTLAGDETL